MQFTKLHGCGNSFIVSQISSVAEVQQWRERAGKLCRPHFGVGADGILLPVVTTGPLDREPIKVVMINPDGSSMGMCGNGIRCVMRYLFLKNIIPATHTAAIKFDVDGRMISTSSSDSGRSVRVGMGTALIKGRSGELMSIKLESGEEFSGIPISMGNPHFVIFSDLILPPEELSRIGGVIEHHPAFPNRTNVEFVRVEADGSIAVQVWERGAGATLACGTGACASMVAAALTSRCGKLATVHMPGGDLIVEWGGEGEEVFLIGPTEVVFSGVILDS
jgi:diaminopimelate epimerase